MSRFPFDTVRRQAGALLERTGLKSVPPLPPRDRFTYRAPGDLAPIAAAYLRGEVTGIRGGAIGAFEKRFAALAGTPFALTVNSGTAALLSAFFAVGVGPGDEVIVPGYTFFATASPLLTLGATPVFAEVEPETMTLDVEDALARCTPRTKAICCVHVWGHPADAARLRRACDERGIALIEDASHAHGATLHGVPVGSFGDVAAFSCQGNKAVSGGELGVVTTSDPRLYDRMLALGHFGRHPADAQTDELDVDGLALGHKFRPHLYGVMMASSSLSRLSALNAARTESYERLTQMLASSACFTVLPSGAGARRGGFLSFLIRVTNEVSAASAAAKLTALRVPAIVDRYNLMGKGQHPIFQSSLFGEGRLAYPWYGEPGARVDLPRTAKAAGCLISVPAWADLSEEAWTALATAFATADKALARRIG